MEFEAPLDDVLTGVVGALFLISAIGKARDPHGFAGAIAAYRIVPLGLCIPFAHALIAANFAVGAVLMSGFWVRPAGMAAIVLFGMFGAAMVINLRRGRRDLDCGCMPGKVDYVSWPMVFRTFTSLFLALRVAFEAHEQDWWMRVMASSLGLSAVLMALAAEMLLKKPQPA